jgi:hypothetical protein
MNQDAGLKPEVFPRNEETAMSSQKKSLESEIVARDTRDKQAAKVFWWILMAMRLVIPLYIFYAIYLYWTLPVAVRYSGGGY